MGIELASAAYDAYSTTRAFQQGSRQGTDALAFSVVGAIAPGPGNIWRRGGQSASRFLKFSARNFGENLARFAGGAVENAHAHHVLPQEFASQFLEKGIDVNNPAFGAWWEASSHLRNAAQYNREWAEFLRNDPTREAILDFGRTMANRYGFQATF